MTNGQLQNFNDIFKSAFGYNRLFNELDRMSRSVSSTNFPPYNISVDDEEKPTQYFLEMAVAGFSKDEISVKVKKENSINYLIIEGNKTDDSLSNSYIVKMIAGRSFKRSFTLSDDAEVSNVKLSDGILEVTVKINKPEESENEIFLQID